MLNMNLQMYAHKKGVGSTKNGRDSESKRLGAKRADGQFVKAGNILYFFCLNPFCFFWDWCTTMVYSLSYWAHVFYFL